MKLRIVLCCLMASHCNLMACNLRIPCFIVAFLKFGGRLGIMLPCSLGTFRISTSATRRAGGYKPPLANSLKDFKQKYKRLICFESDMKVGGAGEFLSLPFRKSSSRTCNAVVHLLPSTILYNSFYCMERIHHTLAILLTTYNF